MSLKIYISNFLDDLESCHDTLYDLERELKSICQDIGSTCHGEDYGSSECENGTYIGTKHVTKQGRACRRWDESDVDEDFPIKVRHTPIDGKQHNYCRAPLSALDNQPWCYTTSINKGERWQHCKTPECDPKEALKRLLLKTVCASINT